MPVSVRRGGGSRPYKLVEKSGKVKGSSKTRAKAEASARRRNQAYHEKKEGKRQRKHMKDLM